jgi:hypothetical protein
MGRTPLSPAPGKTKKESRLWLRSQWNHGRLPKVRSLASPDRSLNEKERSANPNRHEGTMGNVQMYSTGLRGLSFSIADLLLIGAWSAARGLEMVVRLDHGSENEEYEEVIAFHTASGRPCRYIMWRDRESVFVQPLIGRTRRYPSVVDAILALAPQRAIVVSDVTARRWPDQGRPARV